MKLKVRYIFLLYSFVCSYSLGYAQADSLYLKDLKAMTGKRYNDPSFKIHSFDSLDTKKSGKSSDFESSKKAFNDSVRIKKVDPDSIKSSSKYFVSKSTRDVKSKIKTIFPVGSISIGYDYGFLPYTLNMPAPSGAYKTEGVIGLDLLNIPLDITWFYSSQRNLIGLNNYFRISFNADRYKEKLNNNLSGNIVSYKNQLGGLTNKRQLIMQKMAFADYLSSIDPGKWPIDTTGLRPDTNNPYSKFPSNVIPDTSLLKSQVSDSVKKNKYYSSADSIYQTQKYYKNKTDSVKDVYYAYKKEYNQINDSIINTRKKIDELESFRSSGQKQYTDKVPYFSKLQNVLSGIKKFDIGLCYPSSSTFLVNNIPVRGINVEYSKRNHFFAFTYGTTVSTLLYNNQNVEGFLYNVRNSYNYFDFNNVAAGRKILSAKFGLGSKEESHLFAGFLIGKGQSSYLTTFQENSTINNRMESNLVLELDGRYKFNRNTIFDCVLGKSSIKEDNLSYELIRNSLNEIFSPNRSFALLTKLSTKINATNSNLVFSVRWVDPFFKSFGIGFIRSDNMRYEIKLDQPITKKLKYTGMFRYEEDNLLRLMNYKNTFYSFNNTISYRITKGLMVRLGYTPLLRALFSEGYSISNKNSITNCIITYTPRSRKTSMQFNFLYNYYLVDTDTTQLNFQNIAYYHQIKFKSGFKTGFNASWFKNSLRDSLGNNLILSTLDAGYEFKNGSSFSLGGKCAYKLNGSFYPGFAAKVNLKLFKSLYWENQVEKFIVGDLFNGYDLDNLQKFPYFCNTKLIYNF